MKKRKTVEYTCTACGHVGETEIDPPGPGRRQTDKPYVIVTPLQKVVCAWKKLTGFDPTDRTWDAAHWGRHAKTGAILLAFFDGDHVKAIDCCQDIYEKMKALDRDCTIETILKHSADWKLNQEKAEIKWTSQQLS